MNRTHHNRRAGLDRSGFTLVEMLVSVTLVLLMMLMFASIFEMATNSVSKQRGIAENDQRARSLTTILRADFHKRTLRYGLPYYPTENSSTSPTRFGNRSGYLYVSTNDPYSGRDDLLQFTTDARIVLNNSDDTKYFGASKLLYDQLADVADADRGTAIRIDPNQPEADDSSILANGVSASNAAEVAIFLRGTDLIRRVSLLREPLAIGGEDYSIQPKSNVSDNDFFFSGPNGSGQFAFVGNPGRINNPRLFGTDPAPGAWNVTRSNDFWRHFDFSAIPTNFAANVPTNLQFIGIDSLSNQSVGASLFAVAKPSFRFGFNPVTGLSREHDNLTDRRFMGRFLHAETSAQNFNWPCGICVNEAFDESNPSTTLTPMNKPSRLGGGTSNGNPLDIANTPLTFDNGGTVLDQFDAAVGTFRGSGGIRRVEDVLLSNVHEFRATILDERLGQYVTPGYGRRTSPLPGAPARVGDYHISRRLNVIYGPLGAAASDAFDNHVFDTWHPTMSAVPTAAGSLLDSAGVAQHPPFIPYRYYPPRQGDSPPGPSADTSPNPSVEDPQNRGYWEPSSDPTDPMNSVNYSVGDVVFVPWTDGNADGLFQYIEMPEPKFQIAYRCISAGTSGSSAPTSWPESPGRRISEADRGGTAVWQAFDNRRPLKSIRIRVRFFEQNTETIRQLSLVLPVTD